MKFRFCGGLDAPDFLLREFTTLSKIVRRFFSLSYSTQSSVKVKLLCTQVGSQIGGDGINYEKVNKLAGNMGEDEETSLSELKGIVSSIHFVLFNAAKNDVDDITLSNELQQLGLPREHAEAIGRSFRDSKSRLQQKLKDKTLHFPRIVSSDWRADYVIGSSTITDANTPLIRLKLGLDNGVEHTMELTQDKFNVLYLELKHVKELLSAASDL